MVRITDKPEPRGLAIYEEAIKRAVNWLRRRPEVLAIYQIGFIGDPGVSDIDLLVVIAKDCGLNADPTKEVKLDRYLFTHGIYAVPEHLVHEAADYTAFHNIKSLAGCS